jgi:N-methylhydantoinase B
VRIDGITLEILWNRIQAIAHEMGTTLHRTAFSPMVRESHDYSCVVMDAEGRGLGQSDQSIPSFASLLPQATKRILREIPAADLKPGDVLMSNDPWLGSSHLPDVTMVMPYFRDGRLVAFVGAIVHVPDIGGRRWGSEAQEVYEEGVRMPLVYYAHAGELNRELLDLLFANVRMAEMVEGDLRAQAAALALGARRLDDLFAEYPLDDLVEVSAQIQARGREALSSSIAELPEGSYESSLTFEGVEGEPITLRLRLEIAGGRIAADWDGTSPQSRYGLNCVLAYTYAYTSYTLKCVLDPATPNNDGCYDAITVTAPSGCILNPEFPAAVAARHFAGHAVAVAVLRAIGQAAPDKVLADGCVPPWLLQFYGRRPDGDPYTLTLALAGGQGAGMRSDGLSSTSFPTNSSNIPVEVIEATTPLRIVEKALVDGSGGAGRRRGGLGQRVSIRNAGTSEAVVTVFADQVRRPAEGMLDGRPGAVGRIWAGGEPVERAKTSVEMQAGNVLTVELPGGGGFGPAEEREPELAQRDAREGYVAGEPVAAHVMAQRGTGGE